MAATVSSFRLGWDACLHACASVTTIYTTAIVISWLFCCYQYLSHVLFPCMLTTIIYTTVIVISTTCGSLKLSISAIVISLFTCNQTSLYYCCCCMANTRGKSYLWCSFCNLAFLHGLFILAIIHWWWCLPALLNFVYLDLDEKNITCFFSV